MTRFIPLRFSSLVAIPLVALSCCNGEPSTSDLVTLRIGIIPVSEVAPLFVADRKGYFANEGLSVQLQEMAGGAEILPAVRAGDLHLGFSNVVSLWLLSTDGDLVAAIGGTYETVHDVNHALVVRDMATTVADLDGASVAVNTRRNIEELMFRRFLRSRDLDPAAVTYEAMPFPDMEQAVASNDVAAASVVEPFITRMERSGFRVLANHYLENPSDTVLVATYVARREWLVENSEVMKRFGRAFRQATAFLRDPRNDAELREIVADYISLPRDVANAMGLPLMIDCIATARLQDVGLALVQEGWLDHERSAETLMVHGLTPVCE